MKRLLLYGLVVASLAISCRKAEILPQESQLDTDAPRLNTFDKWVLDSLTNPYNINVRYRWNEWNLSDMGKYNFPAKTESVDVLMRVMKHTWIDSYVEAAGRDFIKRNTPREFTIFGGVDRTSNGSPGAWGQAAGGVNVLLFQAQELSAEIFTNAARKKSYSNLIHHEFTHILNQNVPFDEEAYIKITPEGYMAQWHTKANWESQMDGFVSSYARMNIMEDFAEMVSALVTNTAQEWDDLIGYPYNAYSGFLNNELSNTARTVSRIEENRVAIAELGRIVNAVNAGLQTLPATIQPDQSADLERYHQLLDLFLAAFSREMQLLYGNALDAAARNELNQSLNNPDLPYRPGLLMVITSRLADEGLANINAQNEALLTPQRVRLDLYYAEVQKAKTGREKILEKERFVADYFEKELGINLYALRDNVLRQINSPVPAADGGLPISAARAGLPVANTAAAKDGDLVPHHQVSRERLMDAIKTCRNQSGVSYAW